MKTICNGIVYNRRSFRNALRKTCISNTPSLRRSKMHSLFEIIYDELKLTILKSYSCRHTITWLQRSTERHRWCGKHLPPHSIPGNSSLASTLCSKLSQQVT